MTFKKIDKNQPVRLVFLGCGGVTAKHSKTLQGFKNVHRYYASRSENKAEIFCKKWGGKGHFDSYDKAILSENIDVVLVATPPDSHLELTLKAVRAGKHVIVEKPPFLQSSDFDVVETERNKTDAQVMVAENYFYKPVLKKLREILTTDVIGELKFLYFNATKAQKTGDWRDQTNLVGGGALFEGGIHWINFISNLGLNVKSIQGFQPDKGSNRLERSMQIVAEYEEECVATLLYSWEIKALLNGLRISRIYGTKGSITFESNGIFIFIRGKKWRFILPGLSDIGGSKAMFKDFINSLYAGHEPVFNLTLAKRDLTFVERAYQH